jgi:hypothetical protein
MYEAGTGARVLEPSWLDSSMFESTEIWLITEITLSEVEGEANDATRVNELVLYAIEAEVRTGADSTGTAW